MVIGKDFAWGHIGKTGGDATSRLFQCVPDLIERAHASDDPAKHRPFTAEGVQDRKLLLNLRRLPSVTLSYVNHARLYGLGQAMPRGTQVTPAQAIEARRAERELRMHTADGTLPIHRWLRMENLREDFLEFVRTIRQPTPAEIDAIRSVPTKPPMPYDHDPHTFFSPEQIAQLYEASPTWARYEREVYGDLLLPSKAAAGKASG
ncbi:MAG: hypothetical protein DHS20C21_18860 [Gemmatimonadota bacterium]|nr:MAG: hypothetical protein DHS20C21_18860 [Gemmatimonadota bacterium]